jgi:hypothetical protein
MKKWKSGNISVDYYHDEDGKILGKVIRATFSDDTYYAEANECKLGEYINKTSAKNAVEKVCFESVPFNLDTGLFDYTIPSPSCDSEYDTPMAFAEDANYPLDFDDNDTITISLSEEEYPPEPYAMRPEPSYEVQLKHPKKKKKK